MTERIYVVAEGWTDAQLIKRLIAGRFPFAELPKQAPAPSASVDAWRKALAPPKGADTTGEARRPPSFLCSLAGDMIVVTFAGGVDKIADTLDTDLTMLAARDEHAPTAIGAVVDADDDRESRRARLNQQLARVDRPTFAKSDVVESGTPRRGLYVLPGAGGGSKVETLFIEAAELTWPLLVAAASAHVEAGADHGLEWRDVEHFDYEKAVTLTIAALLTPKKPMEALRDSRWLEAVCDPRRAAPLRISTFLTFLSSLLAIPVVPMIPETPSASTAEKLESP